MRMVLGLTVMCFAKPYVAQKDHGIAADNRLDMDAQSRSSSESNSGSSSSGGGPIRGYFHSG